MSLSKNVSILTPSDMPPPGGVRPRRIVGRAAAALEILAIERELAAKGRSVLGELTTDGVLRSGPHYPEGEVWDPVTHAQYFYHLHPEGEHDEDERGHFHAFLGQAGMPVGMSPLVLPEMAVAPLPVAATRGDPGTHRSARDRGVFSHLVALGINALGRPITLFTTNRWVTGETWYRAEDVIGMLDRFRFEGEGTVLPGDRWLEAVLCLLRPHIVDLILARDAAIMDWRRRRSRSQHVFDDRRLEITSKRSIDFAAELAAAATPG